MWDLATTASSKRPGSCEGGCWMSTSVGKPAQGSGGKQGEDCTGGGGQNRAVKGTGKRTDQAQKGGEFSGGLACWTLTHFPGLTCLHGSAQTCDSACLSWPIPAAGAYPGPTLVSLPRGSLQWLKHSAGYSSSNLIYPLPHPITAPLSCSLILLSSCPFSPLAWLILLWLGFSCPLAHRRLLWFPIISSAAFTSRKYFAMAVKLTLLEQCILCGHPDEIGLGSLLGLGSLPFLLPEIVVWVWGLLIVGKK